LDEMLQRPVAKKPMLTSNRNEIANIILQDELHTAMKRIQVNNDEGVNDDMVASPTIEHHLKSRDSFSDFADSV
jgi:hypothetical protein